MCHCKKMFLFKYEYSAERLQEINSLVCWEKGWAGRGTSEGGGGTRPFNYNSMSWASSSEKSDMELSEEEFPPPSSCSLRASSVAYRWMYSERDAQSESELGKLVLHHINWYLKHLTHSLCRCSQAVGQRQDVKTIEFGDKKSQDDVILSF